MLLPATYKCRKHEGFHYHQCDEVAIFIKFSKQLDVGGSQDETVEVSEGEDDCDAGIYYETKKRSSMNWVGG